MSDTGYKPSAAELHYQKLGAIQFMEALDGHGTAVSVDWNRLASSLDCGAASGDSSGDSSGQVGAVTGEDGGERANLRGADLAGADLRDANLILIGQDARDYLFYSYANADNVVVIRAGGRRFVGIAAARAHWETRHLDDPNLHDDCLSLVQRAETMAIARGWKLEPEQEGRRD